MAGIDILFENRIFTLNIPQFYIFSPLKIRVSSTRFNSQTDYLVSQFLVHPDFDKERLNDNIAILALNEPIKLVKEDSVNAACLPACNNMFDHTFANKTGLLNPLALLINSKALLKSGDWKHLKT